MEEFRGQAGELVYLTFSVPYFEYDALTLDVSNPQQAITEYAKCIERTSLLSAGQIPDTCDLPGL